VATPGKYRNRVELRKHRRRSLSYSAKISADGSEPSLSCTMCDVSQSGARLILAPDQQIPDRFVLLLAANGGPRRHCQVVWRDATLVGVRFVQG
jgi:PilZ domain-containing protein